MTSKSEAIRQFIKDNPNASNKEVMEAVAKDGLEVTSNLVNQIRHDYRRKKKDGFLDDDDEPLLKIKKLADDLGGVDRVIKLAVLLKRLRGEENEDFGSQ